MTSAPAPSRRPGHASRREPAARLHRAAQTVLVVGSVLAVAAASGPVWLVRAGVLVAVATSVLSCVLAWRELSAARRGHAQRLLEVDRRHGDVLRTERTRNGEVVDALTERLSSTGMVVAGQRSVIAQLRGEVGVLTNERDGLREVLAERDGLIGLFRSSLREQEAALIEARLVERPEGRPETEPEGAEVHSLPRRSRPADQAPQESVLDPEMAELAMVLPNYEGTRRGV